MLAARLIGRQPLLSFVTVGELTQWTSMRHWGPRNISMLDDWLADKPIIPGSKAIAVTWGGLSAAAHQRGRPRPANDTWIAACALAYGLPLATLNVKDFEDFAQHHGLRLLKNGG